MNVYTDPSLLAGPAQQRRMGQGDGRPQPKGE